MKLNEGCKKRFIEKIKFRVIKVCVKESKIICKIFYLPIMTRVRGVARIFERGAQIFIFEKIL